MKKTSRILVAAAAFAALSGCAYHGGTGYYGDRYAYDYPPECFDKDGYLYPECEDAGYIARSGYGYGSIFWNDYYGPYGWYDGFYYPGYSIYIYDRSGHRHRWSDRHRRHWEGRRDRWRGDGRQYRRDRHRDGGHVRRDGRRGGDSAIVSDRDQRRGTRGDRRRVDRGTPVRTERRGPGGATFYNERQNRRDGARSGRRSGGDSSAPRSGSRSTTRQRQGRSPAPSTTNVQPSRPAPRSTSRPPARSAPQSAPAPAASPPSRRPPARNNSTVRRENVHPD